MHFRRVILAMNAADLPAATAKIGIALLALSHPDTGQTSLTWDEYISLSNGSNRRAAQRHLTRLQREKIIHYSTNDRIYVAFSAWFRVPKTYNTDTEKVQYPNADDRNSLHPKSTLADPHVPFECLPCTDTARIRAISPHTPPMSVVCLDDHLPNTDEQVAGPDPRTVALLTDPDVGIDPADAIDLAAKHTFDWMQRQVATWYIQFQRGKSTGTGGLLHRLDMKWGPGPFPEVFRHTDLYRRHWQTENWPSLAAQDDPAHEPVHNPSPPKPLPVPTTEDERTWVAVLEDLALQMTRSTFDTWVQDTRLLSLDREEWVAVITAPNPTTQTWLTERLYATIRRTLGGHLRHAVTVRIIIADPSLNGKDPAP